MNTKTQQSSIRHLVKVRGRPVLLESGPYGWSAHATETGYFPISHTGFRSFATGGGGPVPDEAELEECSVKFDAERRSALLQGRAALYKRYPDPGEGVGSDLDSECCSGDTSETISRFISTSFAAERCLDYGLFAPEEERPELWETAFLLFDRLARDPAVQPMPQTSGPWTAKVCTDAVLKCKLTRDTLAQFMRGEASEPDCEYVRYVFRQLAKMSKASKPLPPLAIPILDLVVFPPFLPKGASKTQSIMVDDNAEADLNDEVESDDFADDEDPGQEEGLENTVVATCSRPKAQTSQLELF